MTALDGPREPAVPDPPSPEPAPPEQPPSRRTGRLVGGILLVALGVGWLLDVLGLEFPWDLALPVALMAIGVALLVVARGGGSHVGLVTAGIVVAVLALLGSIVDLPFAGGIGDRTVQPTSIGAVEAEYRLGIGQLTVDLSDVDDLASASTIREIRARVGIGQLVLILPPTASVSITATAGLGSVQLFEQEASGFDVERNHVSGGDLDARFVVSVGLGQVEVRRG